MTDLFLSGFPLTTDLLPILKRLQSENLHGPTSPYNSVKARKRASAIEKGEDWIMVTNAIGDMDGKDPRWFDLFVEYFLQNTTAHDDLLFFVRSAPISSVPVKMIEDPIFVRRKVTSEMPQLTDIVDWKETFFLNVVVQTPSMLTVAVCRRGTGDHDGGKGKMVAIRRVMKKVYASPYKTRMDVKSSGGAECSYPLIYYSIDDYDCQDLHLTIAEGEYLCVELAVIVPKSSPESCDKNTSSDSVASQIKEAMETSPSTCDSNPSMSIGTNGKTNNPSSSIPDDSPISSAPLTSSLPSKQTPIESILENKNIIKVNQSEWSNAMGTESSSLNSPTSYTLGYPPTPPTLIQTQNQPQIQPQNQTLIRNIAPALNPSTPFPTPANTKKIILFQGAVPFSALLDIYLQKMEANRPSMLDKLSRPSTPNDDDTNTKSSFVMMRGPHGKGQCQVAVLEVEDELSQKKEQEKDRLAVEAKIKENLLKTPVERKPPSFTDRLKQFSREVRNQVISVTTSTISKPRMLNASLTYVNVPWQSVVIDLTDHVNNKKGKR